MIRKRISAVCMVAIAAAGVAGGCNGGNFKLTVPADVAGPAEPIQVAVPGREATYDFGYIEPLSRHRLTMTVTNPTGQPLTIRDVKTDCGCVAVTRNANTIAPGKRTTLDISFQARRQKGEYVTKAVVITTNPKYRTISLVMRANIGQPLAFSPRSLDIGTLTVGLKRSRDVMLVNYGARPVKILDVQIVGAGCTADVPKIAIPAGRALPIKINVDGGQQKGTWTGSLSVFTADDDQPYVSLPIYYKVVAGQTVSR